MQAPMNRTSSQNKRRAFTLVEMLVAVALISILMLMFAQIFSLAADVVGQQRGIATNDQSERQLRTVIRDDLSHRTFGTMIPFRASSTPLTDEEKIREGYFHIGEGRPENDLDDVLQFTINRRVSNQDESPIYGRAKSLTGAPDPNEPEFDDDWDADGIGASSFAEVVYFIRNGNLYRRVILIRDKAPHDPQDSMGANLIPGNYTFNSQNFWSDFDYAAYFDGTSPRFLGFNHLRNDLGSPSFGLPNFRFGFHNGLGIPKSSVVNGFIGRFTHRETSSSAFRYPGYATATTGDDPMAPTANLNLNSEGIVSEFAAVDTNTTRYNEDVVLTNVHAFDIKVWEPGFVVGADNQPGVAGVDDDLNLSMDQMNIGAGATDSLLADIHEIGWRASDDLLGLDGGPGVVTDGVPGGIGDDDGDGVDDNPEEIGWPGTDDANLARFLDIGHGGTYPLLYGGPSSGSSFNSDFGNCFDTWHPDCAVGTTPGKLPFNPMVIDLGPDDKPGVAGVDDDGLNGVDDGGEVGWPGSDDCGPDLQPGIAGVDDDGFNGIDDRGEIGWPGSDDRAWRYPLKMIRIHIRYVDQKSDQMRDVIIVHSLTD